MDAEPPDFAVAVGWAVHHSSCVFGSRRSSTLIHHLSSHEGVFNPEEVRILTAAFDETWKAVQENGAPFATNGQAEAMREAIALRIIAMAWFGDRDRRRLRDDALLYLARMKDKGL